MAPALGGFEMFDKLIETEPEGANFHNRRSYFMVSSIVVGILFATAVVISIYASDYGLGRDSFEMSMIVAPPDIASPEPQLQQRRLPQNQSPSQNTAPVKPAFVAPLDDPRNTPSDISTSPVLRRTSTDRTLDRGDENTIGEKMGRDDPGSGGETPGIGKKIETTEPDPIPEPPTIKKPVEEKPRGPVSGGVVNGKASYLPKPPYPAAAVALNLQGKVDVQVMIDESGKVISAKAVSGHPFLKAAAERSAWQAKFEPTYLSKMPVKVTGVIVYNFSK